MPKKGPMPSYKTIDDYINAQSEAAQTILIELRNLIIQAVPDAVEKQDYKVPTFSLVPDGGRDQQIMMAAYAKFVSFYPFPSTLAHFADQLDEYKLGKGAIQFPFDTELPKSLIIKMVKYRKEEIMKN